jgi:hypothetical protein
MLGLQYTVRISTVYFQNDFVSTVSSSIFELIEILITGTQKSLHWVLGNLFFFITCFWWTRSLSLYLFSSVVSQRTAFEEVSSSHMTIHLKTGSPP